MKSEKLIAIIFFYFVQFWSLYRNIRYTHYLNRIAQLHGERKEIVKISREKLILKELSTMKCRFALNVVHVATKSCFNLAREETRNRNQCLCTELYNWTLNSFSPILNFFRLLAIEGEHRGVPVFAVVSTSFPFASLSKDITVF